MIDSGVLDELAADAAVFDSGAAGDGLGTGSCNRPKGAGGIGKIGAGACSCASGFCEGVAGIGVFAAGCDKEGDPSPACGA